MPDPEQLARQEIDRLLQSCGWQVQDKSSVNLHSQRGVAVRELSFKTGEPDTLFVDAKAIGTIEAKPAGHSLTGVEEQSEKYVKGVPFGIPAWRSPLPFSFESPDSFIRDGQCSQGNVGMTAITKESVPYRLSPNKCESRRLQIFHDFGARTICRDRE
jgi:type I site-specific restriction endonuclease